MKLLVVLVFALALASAAAFDLRRAELYPRDVLVPVLDAPEGRITNGQTAKPEQFPYQVGLSLTVRGGSAWCGGSLIGPTWVVTAAHCVDGVSSATVYLGGTVRTIGQATRTVSKSSFTIHSGWNSVTLKNDIALIQIPAVTLSTRIGVVKLPAIRSSSSYSTYAGDTATASGWGKTSDSGSVATNLQYAVMTVITNTVCKLTFGATITDSNICVSTPKGVSTCNGDSGGPLVLDSASDLIGIVSFGAAASCTGGTPAAFTRVTSYLDWIKSNTGISY